MERRIRIGVSRCLLGDKVRYDGESKGDGWVMGELAQAFELVPVCPEVEMGMPVPRPPISLVGDPAAPALRNRAAGIDHTDAMTAWCARKLDELAALGLAGFVLKSRSPSCGIGSVELHRGDGRITNDGTGLFARALKERFPHLPVEENDRLATDASRRRFLEAVRGYSESLSSNGTSG